MCKQPTVAMGHPKPSVSRASSRNETNNITCIPKHDDVNKKDTVTKNMNITDPRYPPNIIVIGDFTSSGLYICIPENINSVRIDDNTKDVALLTAGTKIGMLFKEISSSLPLKCRFYKSR